jgi:hypothetical protein
MPRRRLSLCRPMRWLSKLVAIVVLGALADATQPARSAAAADVELYVSLRYEVDGALRRCWDETEFRRSVAQRVGYDPFRDSASVNVSIRVGGSTWAVNGQVEWRNANGVGLGERRFVAKDGNCLRLLKEMSFAVGLQIELLRPKASAGAGAALFAGGGTVSSAGGGIASSAAAPIPPTSAATPLFAPSPPSPTTPPSALPLTEVPKPDITPMAKEPRPRNDTGLEAKPEPAPVSARWPMWLGIGPSLALGIAPSVTGSARLFLGGRRNNLSGEVGAEASYPSTDRKWDGSGIRQSLIGASAAVCRHRQALAACLLGKAGQVRVSGLGVDKSQSPSGFVLQLGLRLAAALELGGPWSASAHIDALGLLTPYTVNLSQVGVWEMPRLGALVGIDVLARFR